ncbi:MAG: hypothetical protein MJ168_05570 [Clostridia bacterium]|nr:hypothetical protein [Clostridia bacterium]
MKKIIAAALSILVGAFGYTIVDKTLEQRVADLEYSVSSLEERAYPSNYEDLTSNSTSSDEDIPTDSDSTFTTTDSYLVSTTTAFKPRKGYSYGYLKIKLPNYGIKAQMFDYGYVDKTAFIYNPNNIYELDGSEISLLIEMEQNSSDTLGIYFFKDDQSFIWAECKLTEENGKIYVESIDYKDASGLTTTTTTTSTAFDEITKR